MKMQHRHNYPGFVLALLLCLGLCGCSLLDKFSFGEGNSSGPEESEPQEEPEYPVTVGEYVIESRPGRIVSLSPSITEKLYDLEAGGRLVGVSKSCDYPEAARRLPSCGTALLPDLEAIEKLSPHLVISAVELSQEVSGALADMEITVVVVPRAQSLEELWERYGDLSVLLEGNRTGRDIGEHFAADFQGRLEDLAQAVAGEEPVPALYLRLLDYTVATGDTLEQELMGRIGLENIAEAQKDWQYPAELAAGDGRKDFERIAVIYCDERAVNIKMLEGSAYYKGLQAVLKDWYLYIDADIFERQSLRMVGQLEEMLLYAYPDAVTGHTEAALDRQEQESDEGVEV